LSISVKDESIYINQLKGNIVIPIKDIKEIRRCTKLDTENSVRKFGSGGFWGYIGIFENTQLGKYQMYVTNYSNTILIKTDKGIFVISCNKPDDFKSLFNL
jgi:hypothetical protein